MFFLTDLINPKLKYSKKCGPGSLFTPVFLYFVFISFMLMIYVFYPMSSNKIRENSEEPKIQEVQKFEIEQLLTNAFYKADLNGDSKLALQELARYIHAMIQDHIDGAIKTNPLEFTEVDVSPKDGLINWDEYQRYYLRTKGYSGDFLEGKPGYSKLNRRLKEKLQKDKLRWRDTARTDSFSLTLDEFFAFRHPEASAANLLNLVDDLLRQFDEDGDENITIDEFSNVIADDLDDKWRIYMIDKTKYQREEEFKRLIDKNKDGKADRSEVVAYLDPRHPRHALQEAAVIFSYADENKDDRLTLKEILKASDSILTSQMINITDSFHDNFQLQ